MIRKYGIEALTDSNIGTIDTIASKRDAIKAAIKAERSAYAAEIEAWLDSKDYRETNIAMRTNRAVGF